MTSPKRRAKTWLTPILDHRWTNAEFVGHSMRRHHLDQITSECFGNLGLFSRELWIELGAEL